MGKRVTWLLRLGVMMSMLFACSPSPSSAPETPRTEEQVQELFGIRFEAPREPPALSQGEAIEVAIRYVGRAKAEGAQSVTARHVRLRDDHPALVPTGQREPLSTDNVDAWLVTFYGLPVQTRGGARAHPPAPPNMELNVIIHADTGEVLETFSYR